MERPKQRVSSARVRAFNTALLAYTKKYYRELPWRPPELPIRKDGSCDPYRIFVSEFMLQQTQVRRVLPKYEQFLKTFPTFAALAQSPLRGVLAAWSGLGYNRRAKNLHRAAQVVVTQYGGKLPRSREVLESLPGIGHSTASGILAFAYNLPEPMIDTNIRRILERVFFHDKSERDQDLLAFAQTLIPKGKGRMWNYAMLDIGASVCGARIHDDKACPFTKLHGPVTLVSRKPKQKAFKHSDRWHRGMIIRELTQQQSLRRKDIESLAPVEGARLTKILKSLEREGLIVSRKARYQLP